MSNEALPVSRAGKKKTRDDILDIAIPLFARHGYEGVSMRDVAVAVGLTPAALYHHFSDKDELYLDGVATEFRRKAATLRDLMAQPGSPWERLRRFLLGVARLISGDPDFLRLMQWVQLDVNESRQRQLAEQVFKESFLAVYELVGQLSPACNAYQTSISVIGLVMFHFEIGTTRTLMPGYRGSLDTPEAVAEHVYVLLRNALGGSGPVSA